MYKVGQKGGTHFLSIKLGKKNSMKSQISKNVLVHWKLLLFFYLQIAFIVFELTIRLCFTN